MTVRGGIVALVAAGLLVGCSGGEPEPTRYDRYTKLVRAQGLEPELQRRDVGAVRYTCSLDRPAMWSSVQELGRQAEPGPPFTDRAVAIHVWCPDRSAEWAALAEDVWGITLPTFP